MADLRLLCRVAETGSISSTAVLLGYSQSGASRRMAAIERAAGTALLVRLPRGVRLTAAGERLRAHALRMEEALVLAEQELDVGTDERPPVRIGAFSTANAALVPLAIRRLAAVDPQARVSVREQRSPTLLRWVAAGTVDLAVVSDYPSDPPPGDLILHRLLDDPLLVALPPAHRLAGRRFSLEELAADMWIEGNPAETIVLRDAARRAGFEPTVAHRVRDWTTKLAFVAAGLGVAVVPGLAAASGRPDVVLSPVPGAFAPRAISIALGATPAPESVVAGLCALLVAVAGHLDAPWKSASPTG